MFRFKELIIQNTNNNNIIMTITSTTTPAPKKSRSKKTAVTSETVQDSSPTIGADDNTKRGRKPRGGKIVMKQQVVEPTTAPVANVILHLKCSMTDLVDYNQKMSKILTDPLEYNPDIPTEIISYNQKDDFFAFETLATTDAGSDNTQKDDTSVQQSSRIASVPVPTTNNTHVCSVCANKSAQATDDSIPQIEDSATEQVNMKEVALKLKQLKVQLYKNALNSDKKSACFWCTCDFDNTPCYIPKYEMDGSIHGYGSFCRPECAVAQLMKENIDESTKFERYQLLNQIYGKVYGYKKAIKPAPDPHYLLDKFYGNLSIQEYRKLLKTEHLLLVLDKPLTRILPELHEDNEDLIMNIYGINKTTSAPGSYKVKRQSEKQQGPSMSTILMNNFGL